MEKHVPLRLRNLSHYHQIPGTQPAPRAIQTRLECVELMTGGRGWVRDGEDWREVLPGDLIWNREGDETIGRSDPERPYSCLAVVFDVRRSGERAVPRFSVWPDLEEVRRFTDRVEAAFGESAFDRDMLRNYIFHTLLFHARAHEIERRVARYPEPVRAVLDELEARYSEPLRMAELARIAGWSIPHLHDVFRAQVGVTPHQALLRRRVRAAREQLLQSGASVKEIAHACGFGDSPAFVRIFKKHTGLTPAVFRQHYLPAA